MSIGSIDPWQGLNTNGAGGTYGGTNRMQQQTPGNSGISDVSAYWHNAVWDANPNSLSTITFSSVYLEYAGNTYPMLFNGNSTFYLEPGAYIATDAIVMSIPANTTFYIRYFWSVPPNAQYVRPQNSYFGAAGHYSNATSPAAANIASSVGTTGLTSWLVPNPIMRVLGTPTAGVQNVLGINGDSIFAGYGSMTNTYISAPNVACTNMGINWIKVAVPGQRAAQFNGGTTGRVLNLLNTHVVVTEYGINDISSNFSYAQVKSYLLINWAGMAPYGKVFQTTITPSTTVAASSWFPTSGQSPNQFNVEKQQINAWLRAPSSAGSGNSAMLDAGGNLAGIIDIAAYCETDVNNTAPNPTTPITQGYWYCGPGNNTNPTDDGTHPTNFGNSLLAGAFIKSAIFDPYILQNRFL